MSDKIEEKLNQILEKVDKIDLLSEKIDKVDKKLEGYIKFSSERITNIEDNMATKKDIRNLKLDLMDKYADKEKVNDHEVRITNLEEKVLL
ncbi:MAG: hypothetical protein QG627_918 [Chlamydiota bacterium]|nr:hypothetical protein [Chlamydiota bacterium]